LVEADGVERKSFSKKKKNNKNKPWGKEVGDSLMGPPTELFGFLKIKKKLGFFLRRKRGKRGKNSPQA